MVPICSAVTWFNALGAEPGVSWLVAAEPSTADLTFRYVLTARESCVNPEFVVLTETESEPLFRVCVTVMVPLTLEPTAIVAVVGVVKWVLDPLKVTVSWLPVTFAVLPQLSSTATWKDTSPPLLPTFSLEGHGLVDVPLFTMQSVNWNTVGLPAATPKVADVPL